MTLLDHMTTEIERAGSDNLQVFKGTYEGGYHIQQRPREFARLVCLLASFPPFKNYLEIGTAAGGCVRFLAEQLGIKSVTVIDDGAHVKSPVWDDQNRLHVPNLAEFKGDSHSQDAINFLSKTERRFDLVGVDGDHSYEGARADWEMVQQFLVDGAIVWFHDCVECGGVKRLWRELRESHAVLLETDDLGIGVLKLPAKHTRP